MYVYACHTGGIYISETLLDDDDLFCEQCEDADWLIGKYSSSRNFIAAFADNISTDDEEGYDLKFLLRDLERFGDVPTIEEATKIVQENKGNLCNY